MAPAPKTPPPGEVLSGGERLWVRRIGSGPRLVAFHGGPGLDHHVLLPLARALADRFEVWLADLPGHGQSPPSRGHRPDLRETTSRLDRWLADLPGGLDVLLGHSMGAWLAVRLLRRRTITPRAAVLVSPPASGQTAAATALRRRIEALSLAAVRDVGRSPSARALAELREHLVAETAGQVPESYVESVGRGWLRPLVEYPELLRQLHRDLRAPARPFDPRCAALVIGGELDRTTPPDQQQQLASILSGAVHVLLPDCGHYPFVDATSATAGAILDFLDGKQ